MKKILPLLSVILVALVVVFVVYGLDQMEKQKEEEKELTFVCTAEVMPYHELGNIGETNMFEYRSLLTLTLDHPSKCPIEYSLKYTGEVTDGFSLVIPAGVESASFPLRCTPSEVPSLEKSIAYTKITINPIPSDQIVQKDNPSYPPTINVKVVYDYVAHCWALDLDAPLSESAYVRYFVVSMVPQFFEIGAASIGTTHIVLPASHALNVHLWEMFSDNYHYEIKE